MIYNWVVERDEMKEDNSWLDNEHNWIIWKGAEHMEDPALGKWKEYVRGLLKLRIVAMGL